MNELFGEEADSSVTLRCLTSKEHGFEGFALLTEAVGKSGVIGDVLPHEHAHAASADTSLDTAVGGRRSGEAE
jgi:hypothetical protein